MKHYRIRYRWSIHDDYEWLTDGGDVIAECTEDEVPVVVEAAIKHEGIHPDNIEIIEVEDVI